jgi:hypothetical protein
MAVIMKQSRDAYVSVDIAVLYVAGEAVSIDTDIS